MRSISLQYGISAARIVGNGLRVLSISSRCKDLRRSTIEKKGTSARSFQPSAAMKSRSCSSMRTESGLGSNGTITTSAARSTFSESSEIPGGQSRNSVAYSADSGRLIFSSRSVGRLRWLRWTSKWRYEKSAASRSRFSYRVGSTTSGSSRLPAASFRAETCSAGSPRRM